MLTESQSQSPEPPKQFVEYKNELSPSRSFKRSSKEKSSPEHSSGQDANQNKVEAELSMYLLGKPYNPQDIVERLMIYNHLIGLLVMVKFNYKMNYFNT